MSIDDFCRWRNDTVQECHYCGIHQSDLPLVNMKSQIQRTVRVMGVDRLDSSKGYESRNLVPCCFVCNQIKGDRFSAAEMELIGQSIERVWQSRLNSSA